MFKRGIVEMVEMKINFCKLGMEFLLTKLLENP